MLFIALAKKQKGFWNHFKPRKKIIIKCRRTLGKVLGLGGGYKTKVECDKEIAKKGDDKKILEVLANSAKQRGAEFPLSLPNRRIRGYDLYAEANRREEIDARLCGEVEKYRI